MKAIHLAIEHTKSGQRLKCEYVQTLARGGRAKALVLRWPIGGHAAMFCLASGWGLVAAPAWRLTADARKRARTLAKLEGLALPEPRSLPLNARARAGAEQQPEQPDPRQKDFPFE